MTSRSPVMHTKGPQEMDFKSVRVVGHEANFHERLFLKAWMSIKDLRSGNGHIVIPSLWRALKSRSLSLYVFFKLHAEFSQPAFDAPLSVLLTLTSVNTQSTKKGSSTSRNVLNETSKRVRRALNHYITIPLLS